MEEKQHLFIVRNNKYFVRYVRNTWGYFMRKNTPREGVKIVIRKADVFIHISRPYVVLLNDLKWMLKNPSKYEVQATKKGLEWIKFYS